MLSPAALSLHNKLCFCKEILDFGLSFTRLALAVTIHGGKTGAGFTATKKNGAKDIDLLNSYWSFLGFLHKSDINTNSHLNLFFSFFCLNLTHTHRELICGLRVCAVLDHDPLRNPGEPLRTRQRPTPLTTSLISLPVRCETHGHTS